MDNFSSPRGMRDFYPEDMVLRNRIFDAWRAAAVASGFEQYDSCVVETLELLQRKAGEEIVDQIYAFKDKSDRDLALRPEMTPTLARMVVARQGSLRFPIKWFTIAQCFRYERTTRGRKREHYQLNLDIIAEESISAEAEVLFAAVSALRKMGVPDEAYRIRVSNRALLSELLLSLGVKEQFHQGAFIALDKKGKIPREQIEAILREEGLDDEACTAAFNLMDISSLEDAEKLVGEGSPAVKQLRELFALLDAYGIGGQAVFDISVIRGLSYYTGIVFEAFDTKGEFRAIFGGGRYDNLLSTIGGDPAPAVGLGFGDVVVGELIKALDLPATEEKELIVLGYMSDEQRFATTKLAAKLRAEGKAVSLMTHKQKPKAFFSAAAEKGSHAIYIGPDDCEKGVAKLKNLATREETEISL
ncbi:MAG: histidine--tRNA ligase [Kiritimatiellae bacterium]|nr:histidine--tRNA ligase [Kiritimatiellia bacterium]